MSETIKNSETNNPPADPPQRLILERFIITESKTYQHVIPVSKECKSRVLFDKLAPLVRRHVCHS